MSLEIEGFTVGDVIGRGGTAVVYRAREDAFDREVALKVFNVELGHEDTHRIAAELRALGRLAELHPAIAVVFSSGVTVDDRPYLSMRHYAGGSLQSRVRRDGPLPLAEVARLAIPLAGALDVAHANQVIHRDIKPANILLDAHDQPVLSDFGIASGAILGADTSTGLAMMTPAYAAPERLDGESGATPADIYSFAATLWALLTGRAPHAATESDSIATIMRRAIAGDIQPLNRADVPSHVEEALRQALALDPAARPATGTALASSLLGEPSQSPPSSAASVGGSVPPPFTPVIDSPTVHTRQVGLPKNSDEVDDPVPYGNEPGAQHASSSEIASEALAAVAAAENRRVERASRWPILAGVAAAMVMIGAIAGIVAMTRDRPENAPVAVKAAVAESGTGSTEDASSSPTPVGDASVAEPSTPSPVGVLPVDAQGDGLESPVASSPSGVNPGVAVGEQPRTQEGRSSTGVNPSSAPAPTPSPTPTPAPRATLPPPTAPATPPPPTAAPSPSSITCASVVAPMTFSPGLTMIKAAQTFVLDNATRVTGCTDLSGHGITGATISGVAIDCALGPGNGTGSGVIHWSSGSTSNVTIRIDISGEFTGTSTWTITSGAYAGAVGTTSTTIYLGQDRLACFNRLTLGTLGFGAIQLTGR